jgi:hypothetical protein
LRAIFIFINKPCLDIHLSHCKKFILYNISFFNKCIKSIKLSSMGLSVTKIKSLRQRATKVVIMMPFQILKIIVKVPNMVLFKLKSNVHKLKLN